MGSGRRRPGGAPAVGAWRCCRWRCGGGSWARRCRGSVRRCCGCGIRAAAISCCSAGVAAAWRCWGRTAGGGGSARGGWRRRWWSGQERRTRPESTRCCTGWRWGGAGGGGRGARWWPPRPRRERGSRLTCSRPPESVPRRRSCETDGCGDRSPLCWRRWPAGRRWLALGSWYLLGRGALARDPGGGWLLAWALLLPTLALVQGAELGAAAVFGQRAAVWMWRRLFSALLTLAADRLRGEGTGRLLGRILACETLERVALASLPAGLLAATELGGALAALGHGAAARQLVALLALALGSAAALAAGHRRAHGAGAEARRELTGELVEAVAGHRSRLAEGAGRADPEEDARLAGCHALTRALGRWETGLRVALPRVWMVTGLATLAVAGGGAEGSGRVAAALGGLWLGRAGLARLAAALCEASSARSAVREVRPIVAALRAGGCCGGEGGGEGSGSAGACGAAVVPHGALMLEARGLGCRTPDGKRQLVSDAGLAIRCGDRLVLDGPSGAGKSSLAAVLAGQRRADGGLLLLGGLDVATLGGEAWRRRVVAVPQLHANHLFADTLAFNLLLGRGWPASAGDLAAVDEVCRELGLGELLDRLPSGLEQRVGEAGWELSDGEASRVCVARALLQEPELLILDESLAALDPESRLRVLAAVERRAGALVVIAHAAGG
jgi:ATP-binding cassette subfamily B protein